MLLEKLDLTRFSLITATYKRVDLMLEKIAYYESLAAAGAEVIICNDNPEKDLIDQAYSELNKIVYLKNESNLGLSQTRNRMIDISTRQYIVICDDDDELPELSFENLIRFLDCHDCVCVWGGAAIDTYNVPKSSLRIKDIFRFGLTPPVAAQCLERAYINRNNLRYRSVELGVDHDIYIQMLSLKTLIHFAKGYIPIHSSIPKGRLTTKANQSNKIIQTLNEWQLEIENELGKHFFIKFRRNYIAYVKSREFIASVKIGRPKVSLLDIFTIRSLLRKTVRFLGINLSALR